MLACPACHAVHHTDCWNDNGGCAVMGCAAAPTAGSRLVLREPNAPLSPTVPQSSQGRRRRPLIAIGAVIVAAALIGVGAASFALLSGGSSSTPRTRAAAPQSTTATPPRPTATTGPGGTLFASNGCGGCHTLSAADGATGTIGPNLDTALASQDAAEIKQDIVDPNAEITKGYGADIMPQDFGHALSPGEIVVLVRYLQESQKGMK